MKIPKLEDVSAEYASLAKRHAALMLQAAAIDADVRELQAAIGAEQATDRHAERVASLLAGVDYSAPAPIKERLAGLSAESRAVGSAVSDLSGSLTIERQRASRMVVEQFQGER